MHNNDRGDFVIELSEIQNKIETTLMVVERAHTAAPYTSVVCGAYVLCLAAHHSGVTDLKALLEAGHVSEKLSDFICNRLGDHWGEYLPLLTAFPVDSFGGYFARAVNGERFELAKTSGSSLPVVELVSDVLRIGEGDSVADLGCGTGDFIRLAASKVKAGSEKSNVVGYEKKLELAALAEISMHGCNAVVQIVWDDFFGQSYEKDKFDKVFSQPPFAVRGLPEQDNVREFIRRAFPDFPEIPPSAASDWLFAARAVAAMKPGGRAVVILPPSAMHTQQAEPFRRYFVQRNLVEAVIELPAKLFTNTSISTYMVVFSEGNESVKMIRAGSLCEKGRSNNTLTTGGVARIMRSLESGTGTTLDDEICAVVEKKSLLDESCNLTVLRHFADPMALREGVQLSALISVGKRGAAIPSKELDDLVSNADTGIRYVSSGNINDGVVDAVLMNLSEVPEKYASYCVHDGDVLITRVMANNSVFKVAVAELASGQMLLPGGNVLVLTVDPTRADPYFIKSCLENEYAQRYLRNSAVGNMVKTLHYKSLEMLPIPVLPLDRQKEIGDKCREAVRRVVELRTRLGQAKEELGAILATNAADCFAETAESKN